MLGPLRAWGDLDEAPGYWLQVLADQLLMQLPANAPGKAVENGPVTWIPAIHVGNPHEAPGF